MSEKYYENIQTGRNPDVSFVFSDVDGGRSSSRAIEKCDLVNGIAEKSLNVNRIYKERK